MMYPFFQKISKVSSFIIFIMNPLTLMLIGIRHGCKMSDSTTGYPSFQPTKATRRSAGRAERLSRITPFLSG